MREMHKCLNKYPMSKAYDKSGAVFYIHKRVYGMMNFIEAHYSSFIVSTYYIKYISKVCVCAVDERGAGDGRSWTWKEGKVLATDTNWITWMLSKFSVTVIISTFGEVWLTRRQSGGKQWLPCRDT